MPPLILYIINGPDVIIQMDAAIDENSPEYQNLKQALKSAKSAKMQSDLLYDYLETLV